MKGAFFQCAFLVRSSIALRQNRQNGTIPLHRYLEIISGHPLPVILKILHKGRRYVVMYFPTEGQDLIISGR